MVKSHKLKRKAPNNYLIDELTYKLRYRNKKYNIVTGIILPK